MITHDINKLSLNKWRLEFNVGDNDNNDNINLKTGASEQVEQHRYMCFGSENILSSKCASSKRVSLNPK